MDEQKFDFVNNLYSIVLYLHDVSQLFSNK